MNYLQRIGRSLMLPVAVLPVAAILMGIGYWIDPAGWGANSAVAAFLLKAGGSIIDNMSILFAVGVAFGMSKDQNGAAALSGLVAFLLITTMLSPDAIAMFKGVSLEQVPAAFGKVNNQFIGILSGLIASVAYNKFYTVELPKAMAFFSGRRLAPIMTAAMSLLAVLALIVIWPLVYGGLVDFGESIVDLGALGAGIYAFFNRLLIPTGLHHALNSVFWFDVAGINDIPNFLSGVGTPGVTGMYQAGFFPIMMFGLPAAGYAMYQTADKENKAKVGSIMLAAGFATFFTGVTEPLEFAFMFVAPQLYIVHALFTGISVGIAAHMQWISGFAFSAGFVDMILQAKNPLAVQWYMLIVQGAAFAALYYITFKAMILKFDIKTPGRGGNIETGEETVAASNDRKAYATEILKAVGKDNLESIDNCISRLRLEVVDSKNVDQEALKNLGVAGVMITSPTSIQIVIGTDVQFVADALKEVSGK